MARGGKRTGTPGSAYANRTDLHQAPKAAPGQQYGKAKEQLDAQRAMPLPSAPPPSFATAAPVGPPAQPGQFPLDAPTDRPQEPITHGMPMGPGAGPEVLGLPPDGPNSTDEISQQLRALYMAQPNNDLLRLIELRAQGY